MTLSWRNKFEDFHTLTTSNLPDIKTIMECQHLKDSISTRKNADPLHGNHARGGNNGNNNGNSTACGRGRRGGSGGKGGRGKDGCGGNKNYTDSKNNAPDTCPLPSHQGHTWGECHQNVNNIKARCNGGGNNSNNYNNRNNGVDTHVNESN